MPLIPDEEDFDSRLPPWVYADGAGVELPEAMLSEDAGPTQADPQVFVSAPYQQGDGAAVEASVPQEPAGPSFAEELNTWTKEARQSTRRLQRENEIEGRATVRGRIQAERARREAIRGERPLEVEGSIAKSWRPPIFDQFQEVKSMAGAEDEVPLEDPMLIARADPTADMNSAMALGEASSQNADVAYEQSRYLHNAMSRLRDTEIGFMTRNYV